MSRIEGPSGGQPPAKPDRAGAGKPAEEGEFDRVLEQQGAEGPPEGAAHPTTARRGAGGEAGARGKQGEPSGGGGAGGEAGGGGGEGGQGTGALARSRLRGAVAPTSQALGQSSAAAMSGGAASGPAEVPGSGPSASPGALSPGQVPLALRGAVPPARSGVTGGFAAGSRAQARSEEVPETPGAADAARGSAAEELEEPVAERGLEAQALPQGLAVGPQASAVPVATPVSEAAPPARASDPALVRQVAQQVLAGIETHLVAGRTQVELGLDLGSLGQARVDLARGAEGALQVTFRLDTSEAQLAVARNLPDLAQALEQKGYAPTIELRGGDGSPLGGDPGRDQQRQGQPGREQGQGRSRGRYVPLAEEES